MPKYRKKPVVIEASQWHKDGDHPAVIPRPAIIRFDRAGHYFYVDHAESDTDMRPTAWLAVDRSGDIAKKNGEALPFAFYELKGGAEVPVAERPDLLDVYMKDHKWSRAPRDFGIIETLEGRHIVTPGDWIITGVKGEQYPCKPDIFEATYEPVE
jgi:hypothetical protein